jgi:hypothetical protein
MEYGQNPYNHEEEVKGQNISMDNEETKFNGNRERMEPLELVWTIRSSRMEVQSCKVDNDKIIKA